ncbi:MAG: hypothetical protein HY914_01380 [Desulfomonile tiedjei]|nr:hypothetical protein [Desulfomonile tiedjei]
MNRAALFQKHSFSCFALVLMVSFLPFLQKPKIEDPNEAINRFATLFVSQDAQGLLKIIQPDMINDKEIKAAEVEAFLKRYRSKSLTLEGFHIDNRFKSEDGEAERIQVTVNFRAPALSPSYSSPAMLTMSLLWVAEKEKWWLERPLYVNYVVTSNDSYPTDAQRDLASRFEATTRVLDKLGLPGTEDLEVLSAPIAGTGVDKYRELDKLYEQERSPKGIDPRARGVQVMLDGARHKKGGLLQIYLADFEAADQCGRRSVPWDMFRDYAQAAVKSGKSLELNSFPDQAEAIYRRIMSLGRQFLNEGGGLQFTFWGLTFQKQGAEELARLLDSKGDKKKAATMRTLASLAGRRIDLLQTALNCLDDMADYKSLMAATIAAGREGDMVFRPWGINTLTILALKGAPAAPEAVNSAGGMVMVENPAMRKAAWEVLEKLTSGDSGTLKTFIERQKEWVTHHQVYGSIRDFR